MSTENIEPVKMKSAKVFTPEAGLSRQVLAHSEKMMLVRHRMEKGWIGTKHSHPHEQLVYVVSGHILFNCENKIIDARAGDSFVVPSGIEHQASALEESEALDVFTPAREDYAENAQ